MTSISNPRRLLILSPTSQSPELIPPFLHSLTGSPVTDPPTPAATDRDRDSPAAAAPPTTFAGYTTHPPLRIENKYYKAEIPIWVDEVGLSTDAGGDAHDPARSDTEPDARIGSAAWKTEFLSQDAGVVRDAIGGIVICVANPGHQSSSGPGKNGTGDPTETTDNDVLALKELIRDIGHVKTRIEEERDSIGDVAGLVVLAGRSSLPPNPTDIGRDTGDDISDDLVGSDPGDEPFSAAWWEDQLSDIGILDFEIVAWDPRQENVGRNQFGELQGMSRIREVLETHDWTAPEANDDDDLEEQLLGLDEGDGFNLEVNELEREMMGLKMAIERGGEEDPEMGDEDKVEALDKLMLRVQGIKDMSAELPENERKRFAARAVRDMMKEI